jgi:hypothetical protein
LAWAITPCKEHPTYVVWTIHSTHQTQLEKNYHPSHPQENKGGPPLLHDTTSHWLHGNYIPKIGFHYFLTWTNT